MISQYTRLMNRTTEANRDLTLKVNIK